MLKEDNGEDLSQDMPLQVCDHVHNRELWLQGGHNLHCPLEPHLKSGRPKGRPLTASMRSCISFEVSVPVLSLKTYSTIPRSSTMSLLRALAGSPSGPSRMWGSNTMNTEHCKQACTRRISPECLVTHAVLLFYQLSLI